MNAADIALVIDAMDLMYRERLDGFCLVSSDSDFTRLAQRLREGGLRSTASENARRRGHSDRPATGSDPRESPNGAVQGADGQQKGRRDDRKRPERNRRRRKCGRPAGDRAGDVRKTKGIRFSVSEWEEVKRAALAHDIPAAEFVRERILALARARKAQARPRFRRRWGPLIERMFRYTWFLATEKRDAMVNEGRGKELDALVAEAGPPGIAAPERRRLSATGARSGASRRTAENPAHGAPVSAATGAAGPTGLVLRQPCSSRPLR